MEIDPKECQFFIEAALDCGSKVKIFQRTIGVPWEIVVTPKEGTTVQDFCHIKEDKLCINLTQNSALGLYQLLTLLIHPYKKKSVWNILRGR
jgi:hypothetical protein